MANLRVLSRNRTSQARNLAGFESTEASDANLDGPLDASEGPLHYVDFIHSREQIQPVLREVGFHLAAHKKKAEVDSAVAEEVVILAAPGDVSGPSKDQAAAIFTCEAAQSLPKGLPTLPNSESTATVHCGRL